MIGFVILCLLLLTLAAYWAHFRALHRFWRRAREENPDIPEWSTWDGYVPHTEFSEERGAEFGGRPVSPELAALRKRADRWLHIGAGLFMAFLFTLLGSSLLQ